MKDYQEFLKSKAIEAPMRGLQSIPDLAPHLFGFQKRCVDFGLRAGSWGCFLSTGLGKTLIELEYCKHAAESTNGKALILTPLAVARQIEAEGKRFDYAIRVIREQSEMAEGINVCNYDRLEKLDVSQFGAVALDESSILKNFAGKTTRALIEAFKNHRFRMCATATPAPNDHVELGNHSEFLGVLPMSEMLIRWFIHDSADTGTWRLKGHAQHAFWSWMASWSRMASHPKDLEDSISGFDLPELKIHRIHAEDANEQAYGSLFIESISATDMHRIKRDSADARSRKVADLVADSKDFWIVWCDTDYEADALNKLLSADDVVEVRGSQQIDKKEQGLWSFASGEKRVMISKPSLAGFGLNLQHCHNMAFVGRTFSYEMYFQAVRRCWRFGQKEPVNVYLIVTDAEEAISRTIERKAKDHERMKAEMVKAMRRALGKDQLQKIAYKPEYQGHLPEWLQEQSCKESCA